MSIVLQSRSVFCEAWEVTSGIPPTYDYNIVLAQEDPRCFEYTATTIAWMEHGVVTDDFQLGVDAREAMRHIYELAGCRLVWNSH